MGIKHNAIKQPVGQWRNNREIKKIPWDKNGNTTFQSYGMQQTSFKREVHSNKCLPQEIRKISNNLTLYFKELEKEQMTPKVNGRKEIT